MAGCGPAVSGSLRKEEERERNASSSAVLPSSAMALAGRGREERERENGEGVSGEEGAGSGLKHGKVAARSAQASHAARAACTVTILFRNFKFSILPQTYH